eukprot:1612293-Rhodomonas_salina.1
MRSSRDILELQSPQDLMLGSEVTCTSRDHWLLWAGGCGWPVRTGTAREDPVAALDTTKRYPAFHLLTASVVEASRTRRTPFRNAGPSCFPRQARKGRSQSDAASVLIGPPEQNRTCPNCLARTSAFAAELALLLNLTSWVE